MEKEIVVAIIGAGGVVIAALVGTAFWRRQKKKEAPRAQTPPAPSVGHSMQAGGNISVGDMPIKIHGDVNAPANKSPDR
jgi:hypothetical protein